MPGADVRALHPLAAELRRARDDRAVRVAEDDPRAHRDELVREEQPVLEHLLEEQHRSPRLRRDRERDRRAVGRERGPGAVFDLRNVPADVVLDVELLARRDAHRAVPELDAHAEPGERRQDRDQVFRPHAVDGHVAARDRREPDEARDLDVIGADRPLAATERVDPLDAQDVRLDALDPSRRASRGTGRDPGRAARRQRCRSLVSAGVSAAAMTMFSVAITLASSRKTSRRGAGRRASRRRRRHRPRPRAS